MSNENRKNKPVYFSKVDPRDVELLAYAEKVNPLTGKPQNFSKYVKRLIEIVYNKRLCILVLIKVWVSLRELFK